MGNGRKPGSVCSLRDGGLEEDGTNCLAQSPEPGTIGLKVEVDPSIDAANPLVQDIDTRQDDEKASTQGLMGYNINLIAKSPPGSTKDGQKIVAILRELNQNRRIMYDASISGRGEWSGKFIRIAEKYRGSVGATLVELFHEGTHAQWHRLHPRAKGVPADREAAIKDEVNAQTNQVKMYIFTKANWNHSDMELDRRLSRLTSDQEYKRTGTDRVFEQYIRDNFDNRED
ncbi:hypothetical protein VVD49_00815 [Uliginosibacterium sp. H3]|uniref:Uncharacterized protein n=1 Tax=Uliginosibacterium silvisoli TaxID=3114758 RepID=A0ABU6JZG7_9RHOO|nr:hypothetical protein [Uliginosibacterium sp. H3]